MSETTFQKYIERKGITMYAISKKTGVPLNTIDNAFKKTVQQANVRIIQSLATALNMSAGTLLDELINLENGVIEMKKSKVNYGYVITIDESYEIDGSKNTDLEVNINPEKVIDEKKLTKQLNDLFVYKVDIEMLQSENEFFDLKYDIEKIIEFIKESKDDTNHTVSEYHEDYFKLTLVAIDIDLSSYLNDNKEYRLELVENHRYNSSDDYLYTDEDMRVKLTEENAKVSLQQPTKGETSYFFLYEEDEVIESEVFLTPR